jgi:hypothetical protein
MKRGEGTSKAKPKTTVKTLFVSCRICVVKGRKKHNSTCGRVLHFTRTMLVSIGLGLAFFNAAYSAMTSAQVIFKDFFEQIKIPENDKSN